MEPVSQLGRHHDVGRRGVEAGLPGPSAHPLLSDDRYHSRVSVLAYRAPRRRSPRTSVVALVV
jgi:hypothetical protein